MKGLGWMIWQLAAMPSVGKVIKILKATKAKWVSIKVADGSRLYNRMLGTSGAQLRNFVCDLQAAGFEVGGWHWVCPKYASGQGKIARKLIQELELSHYLLDIELDWKEHNLGAAAGQFLDQLKGEGAEVGFCSYRYPSYHPPVPYRAFLGHEAMNLIVPQMYWIQSHNPGYQVRRSLVEYRSISQKPFLPIAPTFSVGQPGAPGFWEPTAADFQDFIGTCEQYGLPGYGFYSLDWVVKHKRDDWIEAIAGPVVLPEPGGMVEVKIKDLNIRSQPIIQHEYDFGNLHKGKKLRVIEDVDSDWYRVEGYVWKKGVKVL